MVGPNGGDGMQLRIGQLATRAGLTVRTLHHYDAIGLLVPSERSENRFRLYATKDVKRLHAIVALKRFGCSLAAIREALARDWEALFRDSFCVEDAMLEAKIRQVLDREPQGLSGSGGSTRTPNCYGSCAGRSGPRGRTVCEKIT
jgi:DNA-binding transcriptional MerR regulator